MVVIYGNSGGSSAEKEGDGRKPHVQPVPTARAISCYFIFTWWRHGRDWTHDYTWANKIINGNKWAIKVTKSYNHLTTISCLNVSKYASMHILSHRLPQFSIKLPLPPHCPVLRADHAWFGYSFSGHFQLAPYGRGGNCGCVQTCGIAKLQCGQLYMMSMWFMFNSSIWMVKKHMTSGWLICSWWVPFQILIWFSVSSWIPNWPTNEEHVHNVLTGEWRLCWSTVDPRDDISQSCWNKAVYQRSFYYKWMDTLMSSNFYLARKLCLD